MNQLKYNTVLAYQLQYYRVKNEIACNMGKQGILRASLGEREPEDDDNYDM
jgi:hypothetical protein